MFFLLTFHLFWSYPGSSSQTNGRVCLNFMQDALDTRFYFKLLTHQCNCMRDCCVVGYHRLCSESTFRNILLLYSWPQLCAVCCLELTFMYYDAAGQLMFLMRYWFLVWFVSFLLLAVYGDSVSIRLSQ